jgi:hypothetical protein
MSMMLRSARWNFRLSVCLKLMQCTGVFAILLLSSQSYSQQGGARNRPAASIQLLSPRTVIDGGSAQPHAFEVASGYASRTAVMQYLTSHLRKAGWRELKRNETRWRSQWDPTKEYCFKRDSWYYVITFSSPADKLPISVNHVVYTSLPDCVKRGLFIDSPPKLPSKR